MSSSHNHINQHTAGGYAEAQKIAQDLVGSVLPKAVISVRTVRHGGDLALTTIVMSPGSHPQEEVDGFLDCVREDMSTVNWVKPEEEMPPDQLL